MALLIDETERAAPPSLLLIRGDWKERVRLESLDIEMVRFTGENIPQRESELNANL